MVRDVYCIKCGKKFEKVQFDENNKVKIQCDKCGKKFTLEMVFEVPEYAEDKPMD